MKAQRLTPCRQGLQMCCLVLSTTTLLLLQLGSTATLLLLQLGSSDAYITSHGAVPVGRQRAWLKELTDDLCQVQPGQLSTHQLTQANEIMYAWSHTKPSKGTGVENALAVESLVKRVIDERIAGNADADLTTDDYNCLLEGWARSGQGPAAAERCEQIVSAMQQQEPLPDLSSFKAALMAWRQASGEASYSPLRAQRLLEWMIDLSKSGENADVLPDADCFDLVLQTWSRSRLPTAPQQAEHVLGVMERLYESTGLEKLKPRTLSFNAVLAAWSKSGAPTAADRASNILAFMELLEAEGDETVAPDAVSYATVMMALTHAEDQAPAAAKADAFLQHVLKHDRLVPDTILFNTAMGCWAKATSVNGAYRRARAILDCQIEVYNSGCDNSKPDVYGFTSVIASCTSERGNKQAKSKAFQVALGTFRELQEQEDSFDGPNHVTYGTMLKACAKLLPASSQLRRQTVRRVFQDCIQAGCVGDMVLARLREATSPDVYKELMAGNNKRSLPLAWTVNVKKASDHRRKRQGVPKRKRAEV